MSPFVHLVQTNQINGRVSWEIHMSADNIYQMLENRFALPSVESQVLLFAMMSIGKWLVNGWDTTQAKLGGRQT